MSRHLPASLNIALRDIVQSERGMLNKLEANVYCVESFDDFVGAGERCALIADF